MGGMTSPPSPPPGFDRGVGATALRLSTHRRLVKLTHDLEHWALEDERYAIDRFFMRSSDGHGHSAHVRVNVPPQVMARLEDVVMSRRFPYRSSQDVVRDAISHRLHQLSELAPDIVPEEALANERRKSQTELKLLEIQAMTEEIKLGNQALGAAVANEDWMAVNDLLSHLETVAEGMRQPYRGQLIKLIRDHQTKYRKEMEAWEE